jgi:hypothetical protein
MIDKALFKLSELHGSEPCTLLRTCLDFCLAQNFLCVTTRPARAALVLQTGERNVRCGRQQLWALSALSIAGDGIRLVALPQILRAMVLTMVAIANIAGVFDSAMLCSSAFIYDVGETVSARSSSR